MGYRGLEGTVEVLNNSGEVILKESYNEQENFWASEFGDEYIKRNSAAEMVDSNQEMFKEVFSGFPLPSTALEIGSNVGLNIEALQRLSPNLSASAVEINPTAAEILKESGLAGTVFTGSFLEAQIPGDYDFVFCKGVLIHVNPDDLPATYRKISELALRYVMFAEYYNPSPIQIDYRGHKNKLFKRDFAGEFLDMFPDFELIKTGFAYHRGKYPQDDLTWFLMKKIR